MFVRSLLAMFFNFPHYSIKKHLLSRGIPKSRGERNRKIKID
jgi:hypothetical protein